jgi:hypothetical protein
MKTLALLVGSLLCCALAQARPQFIDPTRVLSIADLDIQQADVDHDWILARGLYRRNVDPEDPAWQP